VRTIPFLLAISACGSDGYSSGLGEPIRVTGGDFIAGDFPADDAATTPTVLYVAGVATVVTQGQAITKYSGLASKDAFSVAVALPDLGTGYWAVPVDGPDVTQNNDLLWGMNVEITPDVPFGLQTLTFAALDKEGHGGPPYETQLCILPESANGNLAACDPATMPQADVLSLTWDTDVDLDLVVVAPNGKIVSPKTPTTALPTDGTEIPSEELADEHTGTITRDSNADCRIDGINRESLVFSGAPPQGEYLVYADLSRSCGRSYVNFQVNLFHRGEVAADGTWPVEEIPLAAGELLADQADAGATLGLFAVKVTF
jgi:hypothetical protein